MSTKSRRAPTVAATPIRGLATPRSKQEKNAVSKQAVLDNFDLEVSYRTRAMRSQLDTALATFMAGVEAQLVGIPRALRSMTIGELESCWAGSLADTNHALANKQFEARHPKGDIDEAAVLAAAKRKREAQSPAPGSSPRRSVKNARTKAKATTPGKRRVVKKAIKPTLPASTSMSTLPQDHIFNPFLPKTPKSTSARAPRRNESILSMNGSPIDLDQLRGTVHIDDAGSDLSVHSDDYPLDDDNSTELPNVAAMEAAAMREESERSHSSRSVLGRSVSKPSRTKRAPSLHFRASLTGGGASTPAPFRRRPEPTASDLESVQLSDGRTIEFDPATLTPGRIEAELARGGLSREEQEAVRKEIAGIAVAALQARLERFSVA